MAEDKKEIEDILAEPDEEDLYIEEAVSEPEETEEETPDIEPEEESESERPSSKRDKTSEKKPEKKAEKPEPKKKEEDDILEKAVSDTESGSQEPGKDSILEKPIKVKKKWWKVALVVTITALVTAAAVLGVVYWLSTRNQNKVEEPKAEETKTEEPAVEPAAADKSIYVNAVGGLNLRKEPNTTAEILAIIPNGTKLTPLETSGEWIKVTYETKTGWVKTEFTTTTNPLVYENTDYGFSLTFPQAWAGYKFFKKIVDGVAVYYVALPTTDKNWSESAAEAGYASFFTVGVYTKAQWAAAQSEEMKPLKIGEKGDYIFSFSSGQATPTDLTARFNEIKGIIDTFKIL
jgi:uncharacterized protein YgiM (DUF1202 family)